MTEILVMGNHILIKLKMQSVIYFSDLGLWSMFQTTTDKPEMHPISILQQHLGKVLFPYIPFSKIPKGTNME